METSKIFKQMGLGFLDPGLLFIILAVLLLIAIIFLIVFIVKINRLQKRLDTFVKGKNARSLEEEIAKMFDDHRFIKESTERNKREISNIYRQLKTTYQKLGIVKYDAFQQMGGSLSFSLALLNERNDGFILNSVHSSDGCYSYTKEIIGGQCSLDLGEEEQMALDKALRIDEDE